MNNKELYISYCWDDNIDEWINKLYDDLKDDVKIILDKDKMKDGTTDISRFISDNMKRADYIAIIVTPEYKRKADIEYRDGNRSWVEIENDYIIERYQTRKKTLLPIVALNNQGEIRIPNNISSLSYYDLSSPQKYESEILRIKQVLKLDDNKQVNQKFNINESISAEPDDENLELQVNSTGIIPRLSSAVNFFKSTIYLDHIETVNLFLTKYVNCSWIDSDEKRFFNDKLSISINDSDKKILLDKIDTEIEKYINQLQKYEATFEIDLYDMIEAHYQYKLIKIEKFFWKKLIEVANEYDWDKGKSEWNIFQMNLNIIHVFSPAISYNKNYNSGEHAIFYAYKDDSLSRDDVVIYIDTNDMVGYHYEDSKMNKRDRWGVRTAAEWLNHKFIPFVCKKYNFNVGDVISRNYKHDSEEIFSEMQIFYMQNKVKVTREEVNNLIKSLSYCLAKKYPYDDYNYMSSKLAMESIDLNEDSQSIAQNIVKYINSSMFTNRIRDCNNNSLADDLLRCIKVFTDSYSTSKLDVSEYKYITLLNRSLISKMKKINLLRKYCF